MNRLTAALLIAAAALAATALAGVGRPEAASGDAGAPGRTVTTTGHGAVTATPDTATVTVGVRVEAADAAGALARCSATATKVIAAVKAAGGRNVRTAQISLSPQTNDAGKTTGYVAENDVSADTGVAQAGPLVDAATGAGATTVAGVSFSLSSSSSLYKQALAAAFADAKAKAAALGQAGAFTVGAVQAVSEQSAAPQPVAFGATAGKAADTPVEPGSQDVTADVQVTFAVS
jgi:uncharacterized protein YggE